MDAAAAAGDAAAAAEGGAADDGSLDLHTQVGKMFFMRCLLFSFKSNRSKKRTLQTSEFVRKKVVILIMILTHLFCNYFSFPKESSKKER